MTKKKYENFVTAHFEVVSAYQPNPNAEIIWKMIYTFNRRKSTKTNEEKAQKEL